MERAPYTFVKHGTLQKNISKQLCKSCFHSVNLVCPMNQLFPHMERIDSPLNLEALYAIHNRKRQDFDVTNEHFLYSCTAQMMLLKQLKLNPCFVAFAVSMHDDAMRCI